ncbi:HAMP domain-containing histidine kinase [Nostocaceae cyanobacterium CENA357]|uniref:histidine kinase n=1 Tax=Atlanticothrix silvestris CENA357 TaxID=1725252 RepID=A0A8J7HFA3_9CYAN|nr:HAMP domain-containing sensor histidine kinase [Atlanticothrix silvestris]MBH8551680.1 HAMP domain-containing histidine kinase [Atlanticothrix silvestris CENA357]
MDFSQVLAEKTDTILHQWVTAVRKDRRIESADDLSYTAIRNHIPDVLKAMVTVLSKSEDNDIRSIVTASLQHGVLRSEQGFDPAEIAREYHLLRTVIFETIELDLLKIRPAGIIRSMRLIDAVIDEAIARCFKSYVDERLREIQYLYASLTSHNEELTRLVSANQEYISQLAHDLKHPLTSIIGYSDLFLRQQRQKNEVKDTDVNTEHIERVLRNGRHLLRLINDVLEISRYDAGQIKLKPAPTNVRELINDVCEMLEPIAVQKNLQIVVNCDRAPEEVITDSLQLQQVVTNLVSNAIRYTNSGTIKILCQVLDDDKQAIAPILPSNSLTENSSPAISGKMVIISEETLGNRPYFAIAISDTGIGIAPEDQNRIFEPYFRANSANQPPLPDSTGLGLAIVYRLVKLLQGQINLISQVGVGSTFFVKLPLQVEK